MSLHSWLIPLPDETFTSWLFRCAVDKKCKVFTEVRGQEYFSCATRIGDPDFNFSSPEFMNFCHETGLSPAILIGFFKPEDYPLALFERRFSFCWHCVREDIKKHCLPCWRKSWCYTIFPYCQRHKCLLLVTDETPNFYKPWHAFATPVPKTDPQHELRLHSRRWGGISSQLLDPKFGFKIQVWFRSLKNYRDPQADRSSSSSTPSSLFYFCESIFRLLLFSRTKFSSEGLARYIFNNGNDHIEHLAGDSMDSALLGAARASPYHRMVALVLIGYIFEVFSEMELYEVVSAVELAGYTWPSDVETLGRMCAVGRLQEYREFIGGFPAEYVALNNSVALFVKGASKEAL